MEFRHSRQENILPKKSAIFVLNVVEWGRLTFIFEELAQSLNKFEIAQLILQKNDIDGWLIISGDNQDIHSPILLGGYTKLKAPGSKLAQTTLY